MTAQQFRTMADVLRRGGKLNEQSLIDALMAAAKIAEQTTSQGER